MRKVSESVSFPVQVPCPAEELGKLNSQGMSAFTCSDCGRWNCERKISSFVSFTSCWGVSNSWFRNGMEALRINSKGEAMEGKNREAEGQRTVKASKFRKEERIEKGNNNEIEKKEESKSERYGWNAVKFKEILVLFLGLEVSNIYHGQLFNAGCQLILPRFVPI